MKVHHIKVESKFWDRVKIGVKPWEVRLNDRDYQTGDQVVLREWSPIKKEFTEEYKLYNITYLLQGKQYGLKKGYCIFTLESTTK